MIQTLFGPPPGKPDDKQNEAPQEKKGLFARLKAAVQSTKESFVDKIEQTLRAQIGELRHLDHAIALLGWDEETMLPLTAREERGEQ